MYCTRVNSRGVILYLGRDYVLLRSLTGICRPNSLCISSIRMHRCGSQEVTRVATKRLHRRTSAFASTAAQGITPYGSVLGHSGKTGAFPTRRASCASGRAISAPSVSRTLMAFTPREGLVRCVCRQLPSDHVGACPRCCFLLVGIFSLQGPSRFESSTACTPLQCRSIHVDCSALID